MKTLTVKKINVDAETLAPQDLTSLFEKEGIVYHTIAEDRWKCSDDNPRVSFAIAHTGSCILLNFRLEDTEVRAVETRDDGRVWEDSCCEFFVSPQQNDCYYNFECNAIGRLLLHGGVKPDRPGAPQAILDSVRRWSSLGTEPFENKQGPGLWELSEIIPASALYLHNIESLDGLSMTANFYKCGDKLTKPHFLSWNRIELEQPMFHCPEFFGCIYFENTMDSKLKSIVDAFDIKGTVAEIKPFGGGIINDTYKVSTDTSAYVLQRINHAIFKDVDLLQHNITSVCRHIRTKLEASGTTDVDRKVLTPVSLKDSDKTYLCKDGEYWRMTVLIKDSHTINVVNEATSYDTGRSFGEFEAMLADIDVQLGESIPDFHNMELRSRQLKEAVEADVVHRYAEVKDLVDFIAEYDEQMCKAECLYREGKLPKRICHCDTKVNNILFDSEGKVLCVIDLDTVMPSFVFSDFGDFMRTAGSTLDENDPSYDKVEIRMDIFKAFTRGYLETASAFLTPLEKENLPYAVLLFPYMQAVRFLTDYLNGDTYYKTSYPEHNLVRTRNQLALFKSALAHLDQMSEFVKSI